MTKAEDIPTSNEWAKSFEGYLFGLGPISGKFSQLDKFGQLSKGNFWSNGKGSIKFSYLPESELMITINDGLISVKETKNSPVNKYSIKDSPISGLFSEKFSLDNFTIKQITIEGNIGTIELRTKENSKRNSIYLTGDYPKPKLRQWKLIDTQNNETLVFFSKISKFDFLDENFFNMD
jgi:outer membrane lipoprotein-sorting protein